MNRVDEIEARLAAVPDGVIEIIPSCDHRQRLVSAHGQSVAHIYETFPGRAEDRAALFANAPADLRYLLGQNRDLRAALRLIRDCPSSYYISYAQGVAADALEHCEEGE